MELSLLHCKLKSKCHEAGDSVKLRMDAEKGSATTININQLKCVDTCYSARSRLRTFGGH